MYIVVLVFRSCDGKERFCCAADESDSCEVCVDLLSDSVDVRPGSATVSNCITNTFSTFSRITGDEQHMTSNTTDGIRVKFVISRSKFREGVFCLQAQIRKHDEPKMCSKPFYTYQYTGE